MINQTLTPRENEIIQLLALGYSDKEIASQLVVSENTIRTHHRNIYLKTNSQNLADVTRWWFQTNFDISLGLKPRVKLLFWMAALILSMETVIIHSDMLRPRSARSGKTTRGRKNTRKLFELA